MVDALYWLKTPGESDGCTQTLPDGSACGRFDPMCASADSIGSRANEPRAPVAGTWFDYQVKMLATNGHLHTASSSFTSTTAAENRVEGAAAKPITKTSKAFAACDASSECAAGYTCEVATLGVCMPTEETVQARGHDGAFATRLVHALRMAAAKEV